jgi:hypothetical protein
MSECIAMPRDTPIATPCGTALRHPGASSEKMRTGMTRGTGEYRAKRMVDAKWSSRSKT